MGIGSTVNNFEANWQFAQERIEQVCDILRRNAMHIVKVEIATSEEDLKQSTDLKVKVVSGDVAVRVRRGDCRFRDLTIRAKKGYAETEVHKLRRGYADWYLYAWTDRQGRISEWILVDVNKMRAAGLLDENRELIMNTDGDTGFYSYPLEELDAAGALVEHEVIDPVAHASLFEFRR